jgi:molybdopterin-containing oxidoreductase family iron-sulfur binding subunit
MDTIMEKKKTSSPSRRNFVKTLITGSIATTTAAVVGQEIIAENSEQKPSETGEKMKLLTTDGQLVEVDSGHISSTNHSHIDPRKGIGNKKMVMVIDLSKCRNARKCVTGCQEMHNLPPDIEWIKMYLMRDSEDTAPYWFPKPCLHCNNPPCVKVCPVGATFKRTDGIVLIDNERCIGCKFCMAACPYSSRVFHWNEPHVEEKGVDESHYSPETSVPAKIGTVSKCDFCPDMVRMGKLPACVTECPNGVFYFGDKNLDTVSNGSETLRFSKLINDRAAYRYMEELGTEPSVFYLPPVDRMFDYEIGFEDLSEEEVKLYKKQANITE